MEELKHARVCLFDKSSFFFFYKIHPWYFLDGKSGSSWVKIYEDAAFPSNGIEVGCVIMN